MIEPSNLAVEDQRPPSRPTSKAVIIFQRPQRKSSLKCSFFMAIHGRKPSALSEWPLYSAFILLHALRTPPSSPSWGRCCKARCSKRNSWPWHSSLCAPASLPWSRRWSIRGRRRQPLRELMLRPHEVNNDLWISISVWQNDKNFNGRAKRALHTKNAHASLV